ncbi:hypothetical protein GCM10018781_40590 [Kitasatospora indigofera]|uniref:Uncharacterized protein n=1 Tax=Kitasatospora indigofera TaxID=67307 RepID=A0A919KVS7_9ACTN|nr:hypothetical protein GCM10018781_40590 [Kitasatospora indigofera]
MLQPPGIQALEGDGVACIEHFADVIQNNVGDAHQLDTLFKPLREVPDSWHQRFHENTPGYVSTVAPVLVMQGTADTVINPHSTEQYIRRACGFSQPVEYTTYEGATHNTIPFEARSRSTCPGSPTGSPGAGPRRTADGATAGRAHGPARPRAFRRRTRPTCRRPPPGCARPGRWRGRAPTRARS